MENNNSFGANLINDFKRYEQLSEKYNINIDEIIQIDLNRCGVYLKNNEVRVDFRVRFKGKILNDYETWYALPVRTSADTHFCVYDGGIYFQDIKIGVARNLTLDTCESSYQRGDNLLNFNSRSRSNCGGCTACVHNYHNLYDASVLKDKKQIKTIDDINEFFDTRNLDVSMLVQIAVVTGLFKDEDEIVEHMTLINEVAKKRGFSGELMYFGCQVNSSNALKKLSELGNFSLIYALDNFTKRDMLLSKTKSLITLEMAKDTLLRSKENNIRTSIAYICGIDPLEEAVKGFKFFKDSLTSFPIINIYQTQTLSQAKILDDYAKYLEYYLESRKALEEVFKDTFYRPKRWENYRPLWYKYFANEELLNNSFGQLEKIKVKEKVADKSGRFS